MRALNPLREMASDAVRLLIFPAFQRRRTPEACRYLHEYQRLEFAPLDAVERIQLQRLKRILEHAAANVPYYRETFRERGMTIGEIRSLEDLRQIPILTKDILKEQSLALLAEKGEVRGRRSNASGGSTGRPAQFFQDQSYWEYARANQWFVESWWSIRPGDRTASIWGCDRDILQQSFRERLAEKICQVRTCNAFAITGEKLEEFAKMLMVWRPRFVTGYASALELFSEFLLTRPDLRIRPVAVKSTAEALSASQRTVIEKAFDCPLYNFYGSREVNNIAAECPSHLGLHINALARHVEILDESGAPVAAGTPGRIVVTDLTNFAMPFIRYEIEDIGTWAKNSCSCGRQFPLLAKVLGRSSDFIATPSGRIIHGEYFTHLFYDLPQVNRFRLTQSTLKDVRVDIVLQPEVSAFSLDGLQKRIGDVLGPEVNFQIRIVPSIDRTASGKYRFTVSSVRMPWGAKEVVPSAT